MKRKILTVFVPVGAMVLLITVAAQNQTEVESTSGAQTVKTTLVHQAPGTTPPPPPPPPAGQDSNNNGLDDLWEVQHFGQMGVDPSGDADGDGLTNLQEYQAQTDPLKPHPGWVYFALPETLTPLAASPDGIALLRDGTHYWRWAAGNLTQLGEFFDGLEIGPRKYRYTTAVLNHRGDVAIQTKEQETQNAGVDATIQEVIVTKVYPLNGASVWNYSAPSRTVVSDFTDSAVNDPNGNFVRWARRTHTSNALDNVTLAEDGALWGRLVSGVYTTQDDEMNAQYQGFVLDLVRIAADQSKSIVRADVAGFFGLDRSGRPIGTAYVSTDSSSTASFVGAATVPYLPETQSFGGRVIGLLDGQRSIYESTGTPVLLPASAYPYSFDSQERVNGSGFDYTIFSFVSYLLTPTGPGGAWQQIPYINLPLPTDWSSGHQIALGGEAAQLGYVSINGGPLQPFFAIPSPAQLAVDANRDGQIHLPHEELPADERDITSATRPHRFWVNDDDDDIVDASEVGLYSEIEDDDKQVTNPVNEDWRNNVLDTPRDLEDFARIWVNTQGLNDSFKNGQLYLGLKWKNTNGTPAIKLHRSRDTTGSADYLFNTAAASLQSQTAAIIDARYPDYVLDGNFQSDHTLIEGSGVFIIPTVQFSALSESNNRTAFLFESCKGGRGQLALVILKREGANYTEIGEGPGVWLDLKAPKDFIERWSVGNDALGVVQPVVRENSKSVSPAWGNPVTEDEKDYVLYVHGYNMQEFEKQRWIETTFKRLYWLGYKGRVGGFAWPCSQSAPPYDASEERAWQSATQLKSLLSNLKAAGYRVHVLAHSQGNVVASEVLRQWKEAGNTTSLVRTYIASQAAIQAHCYDAAAPLIPGFAGSATDSGTPNVYMSYPPTGAPYMGFAAMSGAATNWINFQNPRDYALTGNSLDPLDFQPGWQVKQRLKPDEGFGYDAVLGFFDSRVNALSPLNLPQDRHTIFAYCAEGRSLALGSTTTGGVFASNNTDLEATLGYGREHRYHSAQFRSFMSERYEYWRRLMLGIGLQPFTP